MRCQKCDKEIALMAKYCSSCGTEIKIELEKQQDSKISEEVNGANGLKEDESWPQYTDDDYRNEIVKSVRIVTVLEVLSMLGCLYTVWQYKEICGWGWTAVNLLLSGLIMRILLTVLGLYKYFGVGRLKQYDKLVFQAGKSAAVTALEMKKGGIIRKFLIALVLINAIWITDTICYSMVLVIVGGI